MTPTARLICMFYNAGLQETIKTPEPWNKLPRLNYVVNTVHANIIHSQFSFFCHTKKIQIIKVLLFLLENKIAQQNT